MLKKIYVLLNKALQKAGLQLVRYKSIPDFREDGISPFTANYLTNGAACLVSYPISKLQIGWYFRCGDKHPYEVALHKYKTIGDSDSIFKIFKKYSETVKLYTANEWFGLELQDKIFSKEDKFYSAVFPWSHYTKQQFENMFLRNIEKENKVRGGGKRI